MKCFCARPLPDPVTSVNGTDSDICIWWTHFLQQAEAAAQTQHVEEEAPTKAGVSRLRQQQESRGSESRDALARLNGNPVAIHYKELAEVDGPQPVSRVAKTRRLGDSCHPAI